MIDIKVKFDCNQIYLMHILTRERLNILNLSLVENAYMWHNKCEYLENKSGEGSV